MLQLNYYTSASEVHVDCCKKKDLMVESCLREGCWVECL